MPKVLDVNLAGYASGADLGRKFRQFSFRVFYDRVQFFLKEFFVSVKNSRYEHLLFIGMTKESVWSYFAKSISEKLGNVSGAPVTLEGARRVKLLVQRY